MRINRQLFKKLFCVLFFAVLLYLFESGLAVFPAKSLKGFKYILKLSSIYTRDLRLFTLDPILVNIP